MRLKLVLDPETAAALMRAAVRDLRPIDMEAEALLRRALGLHQPYIITTESPEGGGLNQDKPSA